MKLIIPLEFVDRRHSGPVFIGGTWTVRLKVVRGQGSRDVYLDARAARRLACASLLQAEKVEMLSHRGYAFPKGIVSNMDRATNAVVSLHLREQAFRKKVDNRNFKKRLKAK
jgi:hypothetical protein